MISAQALCNQVFVLLELRIFVIDMAVTMWDAGLARVREHVSGEESGAQGAVLEEVSTPHPGRETHSEASCRGMYVRALSILVIALTLSVEKVVQKLESYGFSIVSILHNL